MWAHHVSEEKPLDQCTYHGARGSWTCPCFCQQRRLLSYIVVKHCGSSALWIKSQEGLRQPYLCPHSGVAEQHKETMWWT